MSDAKKVRTVLIVDDEPGIRALFLYLLEPMGFSVTAAANGLEALDLVKNRPFDVIFLDVHMPGLTGPEVLKYIREIRPSQVVAIVSSSSDPDQRFELRAQELGAAVCMFKPFGIDEILNVIEQAVGASAPGV